MLNQSRADLGIPDESRLLELGISEGACDRKGSDCHPSAATISFMHWATELRSPAAEGSVIRSPRRRGQEASLERRCLAIRQPCCPAGNFSPLYFEPTQGGSSRFVLAGRIPLSPIRSVTDEKQRGGTNEHCSLSAVCRDFETRYRVTSKIYFVELYLPRLLVSGKYSHHS